jgi:hypothetical protein
LGSENSKSRNQVGVSKMGWGGRRPGAGRKSKPKPLSGEKEGPPIEDFSSEIAREPDGPARVVLAMAARRASDAEIATTLSLSLDGLALNFEKQLKMGRSLAVRHMLSMLNWKAKSGNVTAIMYLLRRLETNR